MKPARNRAGILVFTATLLLCVAIAEVVLLVAAPISDPSELLKSRKEANRYIPSEFPRNFRLQTQAEPGLPGVSGRNLFTTNNMGFRGDHLVSPKPASEFRIFMVGGSTTECLYLDDSQAVSKVLQDELIRKAGIIQPKVYNAGKSGDALPEHLSMMAHRIVHLEPDMIIVFAGINDLTRSINNHDYLHYVSEANIRFSLTDLFKMTATEFQLGRRGYYLMRRFFPASPTEIQQQISLRSDYKENVLLRKSTAVSNDKPKVNTRAYRTNLKSILGVAAASRIQLVFMTQQSTWTSPDPRIKDWQWMLNRYGVTYRDDLMNDALESLNDVMREVAAEEQTPVYDLAKSMPKSADHFYDDVHFNVKGSHDAGVGLASFLMARRLISTDNAAR